MIPSPRLDESQGDGAGAVGEGQNSDRLAPRFAFDGFRGGGEQLGGSFDVQERVAELWIVVGESALEQRSEACGAEAEAPGHGVIGGKLQLVRSPQRVRIEVERCCQEDVGISSGSDGNVRGGLVILAPWNNGSNGGDCPGPTWPRHEGLAEEGPSQSSPGGQNRGSMSIERAISSSSSTSRQIRGRHREPMRSVSSKHTRICGKPRR